MMTDRLSHITDITVRPDGRYLLDCSVPYCYRYLTFKTLDAAVKDKSEHKCPWGGDLKVSWSVTKTLVEQMWDSLDETMHALMDAKMSDNGAHLAILKPVARAKAEFIALFMTPFFKSADEVAQEAAKRYKASEAGEEYETPGLGNRRYESAALAHASAADGWYSTPDGAHTSDPSRAGAATGRRAAAGRSTGARSAPAIKPDDLTAMKGAWEAMPEIFTPKVLAKQYGYTEAAVKSALGA